jgi:hypothetical protein
MADSADTSSAVADAPPPDETAQYAALLGTNERVLVVRRRHLFSLVEGARWFFAAVGVAIVLQVINGIVPNGRLTNWLGSPLNWGFGLFLLIGLAGVGWYYLVWQRERYLVTTRRVINAGGVINKWQRDTSLQMINDMVVDHPLLGRIVGYGEIELLTASEDGTDKIRYLPDADEFKKIILDAKYQHELEVGGGRAGAAAPAAPAAGAAAPVAGERLIAQEVDDSITHLAAMRARGVITAAEFEAKKRELLDRL